MIKYFLNELPLLHATSVTNRPLHFMTLRWVAASQGAGHRTLF